MQFSNTHVWGLDFGTTTTFLSESEPLGSKKYSLRQGSSLFEYVPSVVRPIEDGFAVGEQAEAASEEEIFRSVKRAITTNRQTLPIPNAGDPGFGTDSGPINADDAIRAVLTHVNKIARRDIGGDPVRLGCPAMWDSEQRSRLLRLASEAGFKIQYDTLIDEPVAACIGWFENELRQNRRPSGTTLVFDMGGGTLDVAALRINADHLTPEIYVLASQGIDEAGDALDEAIRDLLIEKTLPGSDEFELLKSNPGWVRRAARQLKIQLGDDDITKSTLRLPGGASLELELTSDELRTAFEPQFRRALELMTVVMRIAKTTNWRTTAMTGSEVRGYTREELFPEIQNLLLVGGMSQMPLLRKMLVEAGIPSHKIFGKESIDPDAAVSLGLALDQDYDHLSLDRPGFNFELHWLKNGEPHTEVIYEAYSKLYTPRQALTGQELKLTWANETIGSDASDNGRAVFCARTPAGEIVEISYEGELKEGFGPSFALGTEKRPVIIIQPNGRIFMRDATGAETAVKVEKWPVINVARNRTLSITSSDERGNFTGGLAWHERPWD